MLKDSAGAIGPNIDYFHMCNDMIPVTWSDTLEDNKYIASINFPTLPVGWWRV